MNANEALARMDELHASMKNTTAYYRKRFFEEMKRLYDEFEIVRMAWDFVENAHLIIKRFIKRVVSIFTPFNDGRIEYRCEAKGCGAYIVQHFDYNGKLLWTKVGKADKVQKRLQDHLTNDYAGEAYRGVCLHFFPAVDAEHALCIENILRRYFKQTHPLKKQDRFPTLEVVTQEDFEAISRDVKILDMIFRDRA
jgi:hypothetical protein